MLIIRVSALGEALTGKLPLFAHRAYFPPWLKKIKCVFKATAQVVPAAVSYASATSGNLRGMTASGRPRRRSSGSPPSSPRGSRWGFPPGLPPRMAVPGAWLGRGRRWRARPLVDATPGVPGVSRRGACIGQKRRRSHQPNAVLWRIRHSEHLHQRSIGPAVPPTAGQDAADSAVEAAPLRGGRSSINRN
jgi:hypothetical protein